MQRVVLLKEENQEQVDKFLSANEVFELLESKTILPQDLDGDGFYMAKIKRNS